MLSIETARALQEAGLKWEPQKRGNVDAYPDVYEALRWIVKNLTTDEIELAREVWGNTNTRIILEAVEAGRQALAKAKGMD